MRVRPISLSHRQSYRPGGSKSRRERIDTYTKRLDEANGSRLAKKTGNTTTEYRITADRACFFYHLPRRVSVPRTAEGVKRERKGAFLLR